MGRISEVEIERIRIYGFRRLNENKPFEPLYAEPRSIRRNKLDVKT